MALPSLLAVGAVLAALLLVALVATAFATLVRLVLWLSLSRSLLAVALFTLYWVIATQRRRCAKGFYSCSKLPCAKAAFTATRDELLRQYSSGNNNDEEEKQSEEIYADRKVNQPTIVSTGTTEPAVATASPVAVSVSTETEEGPSARMATLTTQEEQDAEQTQEASTLTTSVHRRSLCLPPPLRVKTLGDAASTSSTESEDDDEPTLSLSRLPTAGYARSPMRQSPPAAARSFRARSSSSSSGFSVTNRRRPTPANANATLSASPSGVHSRSRAATVTTAPGSAAHGKRSAFARRSAASEREMMQEKMEADGYWIGDFRPERVSRRSFTHGGGGGGGGYASGNNSAQSSPRAG